MISVNTIVNISFGFFGLQLLPGRAILPFYIKTFKISAKFLSLFLMQEEPRNFLRVLV